MSASELCVIHVPRGVLLDAVSGIVPATLTTIVFAQWSEDKDAVTIGFSASHPLEARMPTGMEN